MSKVTTLAECRLSLDKVFEGADRSVLLLEQTVEKLSELMKTLNDIKRSNAWP